MNDFTIDTDLYRKAVGNIQNLVFKPMYINGCILEALGFHFMENGENWTVRNHSHSFYEFHYVMKNSVQTVLNSEEYEIGENMYYIIPPGIRHSHYQKPGTSHLGLALRWQIKQEGGLTECFKTDPAFDLSRLFPVIPDASLLPLKDDGKIMQKINNLISRANNCESYMSLYLVLVEFLVTIMRSYTDSPENPLPNKQPSLENNLVNAAMRFIEDNYSQPIHAKDVSDSVYLSCSHLSRLFGKYERMSINQYLNKIRLINAQLMLKCSDQSISIIAKETGFSSDIYFCSAFKKAYGISPLQFRKGEKGLTE